MTALAQQAPCAFTARASEVRDKLDEAETAYKNVDVDGFANAMDEVHVMLPCVADRVTVEEAARLHRMVGIQTFANGREREAKAALTAAARTEPTWRVPPDLLPASHPLTLIYNGVQPGPDPRVEVPRAIDGPIRFDGVQEVGRPSERPTLFQLLDADGDAISTKYLWAEDELPDYAIDPTATAIPAVAEVETPPARPTPLPTEPAPSAPGDKKKIGLLVAGIGAAVLGTGAAGVALSQDGVMREATSASEVEGAYERQVAFGAGAYTLWGTGAVLGIVWAAQ